MARVLWPHEVSRHKRAVRRAKAILKPGDRLYVGTCGGRGVTVTMVGWCDAPLEDFIRSKSLDGDELHPSNVRKVNGQPVSFGDPVAVAALKTSPNDGGRDDASNEQTGEG